MALVTSAHAQNRSADHAARDSEGDPREVFDTSSSEVDELIRQRLAEREEGL